MVTFATNRAKRVTEMRQYQENGGYGTKARCLQKAARLSMMREKTRNQGVGMTDFAEDSEPSNAAGWKDNVIVFRPAAKSTKAEIVSFDRRELDQILRVYGFKVADGEWRDYAIDMLKDRAVFSVFRRTAETPMFQIVKCPKLARRQGAFSIIAADGQILKRGHDLQRVLELFAKKPKLVSV